MKFKKVVTIGVFLSVTLLAACGGGGGGSVAPTNTGISDELTLMGNDALVLGGKLIITERAYRPGLAGSVKTLISTSDGILNFILAALGEIPTPTTAPPNYGIVINTVDVGTELDISMRVNQNGKSYLYVCGGAFATKCNNIIFDVTNRKVIYNNVTVEASAGNDASGFLTMNGTLSW